MNAKKYNKTKLILGISQTVLTFILLLLFITSGLSSTLVSEIRIYFENEYMVFLGFIFTIGLASSVIFFPINFYSGFILEHKYNLSTQSFFQWAKEELKSTAVSTVIGIPILLFFFYAIVEYGSIWWLPFAIVIFLVSVVLARIVPVFILPLFYKLSPIEDEDLRNRIEALASDAGIKVQNVFSFDMSKNTKKANAAFTGIGKSKRILLGDTLLNNYSKDEIETVIAHELGHYKKKHIVKNIIIGTTFSFLTLFLIAYLYEITLPVFDFGSIKDIAAIPLIALWGMIVGLILTPLSNILSRKYEFEADEYAVTVTGKHEAFVNTLERLTDQNLGDRDPHPFVEWFFYSHPSVQKRINAINNFLERNPVNGVEFKPGTFTSAADIKES